MSKKAQVNGRKNIGKKDWWIFIGGKQVAVIFWVVLFRSGGLRVTPEIFGVMQRLVKVGLCGLFCSDLKKATCKSIFGGANQAASAC